jgi:hypothetical protein
MYITDRTSLAHHRDDGGGGDGCEAEDTREGESDARWERTRREEDGEVDVRGLLEEAPPHSLESALDNGFGIPPLLR